MTKRVPKRPADAAQTPAGTGAVQHSPSPGLPAIHPAMILLFAVLLAVHVGVLLSAELRPGVEACQRLLFVLLPDQIVANWCGGEAGTVAVLDRAGPLLVLAWIVGTAGLLGALVLDLLTARSDLDRWESMVLSTGLGLSVVSLFALLVGLLGGLRFGGWWFGLLTLVAAGAWVWRRVRAARRTVSRRGAGPAGRGRTSAAVAAGDWTRRWWWLAIPFAVVLLAGAVLPPLDFDVLEYHLQVPKQWYLQGRVTFLAENIYGNMPLGGEMLAAQAMSLSPQDPSWWWGALAGKLALAIFPLLTTGLLFAAGRRWFSPVAGAVAALLYLSTPWVARVAFDGLNENALGFYLLASFYAARCWWDQRQAGHPGGSWLVLMGWFAGSAVSCKYTALLFVVLPMLVIMAWAGRPGWVRVVTVWSLCVVAACGLWLGKNWVLTGNPTYPLLVSVFGGATRTAEKDAQWRAAHQVPRDAAGYRYSLSQAGRSTTQLLWRDPWQHVLLVPFFLPLACGPWRDRRVWYWAAVLAFVLSAWWVTTHRYNRFLVPVLPVASLLAGVGATWHSGQLWRRAVGGVLGLGLAMNFLLLIAPGALDTRFLVSLEQLRDDPEMRLGSQRFIAFDFLDRHVVAPERVLVVGDAAVFDLRAPVLYNTCFDDCRFERLFRGRTRQQRQAALQQQQITYLYINWAELARYRQPGNYGYSSYVTRGTGRRGTGSPAAAVAPRADRRARSRLGPDLCCRRCAGSRNG